MTELEPCSHCGGTELSYRYWDDDSEIGELWGVAPENILEKWNGTCFPKAEDEDELALYVWEAAVYCGCGAHVFGTIDKTDGEYNFIRRWNRRVGD